MLCIIVTNNPDLKISLSPANMEENDSIGTFTELIKIKANVYRLKNKDSSVILSKNIKKILTVKIEKDSTKKLLYLNNKKYEEYKIMEMTEP